MGQVYYPGDRQLEAVDEDDAELALLLLNDGQQMIEIVGAFRATGYPIFAACNVYHAAIYLQKQRQDDQNFKLRTTRVN